jgi:hypothetical protein
MATQSTILDSDWTLIANTADDPVLAQAYGGVAQIEYLTTATDSTPDASEVGHRLGGDQQMTRLAIGDGYIWARLWGRTKPAAIVVSGSTVDFGSS